MKTTNMHTAKSQLSALVDAALSGEEVIIARRGQPVVRLEAIRDVSATRKAGTLPDLITEMPDTFNESLEDWDPALV